MANPAAEPVNTIGILYSKMGGTPKDTQARCLPASGGAIGDQGLCYCMRLIHSSRVEPAGHEVAVPDQVFFLETVAFLP